MPDFESYPAILDRLFPSGLTDPEIRRALAAIADPPASDFEAASVLGRCLWDVFSDNHEVIDPSGTVVDLGSFRGSGDTLSAFGAAHARAAGLNWSWDYLDFYMGTASVNQAAAKVVYPIVFRRLLAHRLDWKYSFPRVYLFDVGAPAQSDTDSWPDPTEAVRQQLADQKREVEARSLRESLDEAHAESVRKAQSEPPPEIVSAFANIYGRYPQGWPPSL